MDDKRKNEEPIEDLYELFRNQNIVLRELNTEMKTSFLEYSMSVIVARALPDVRDGLKPVHRRIIYTMFEDNLTPDKPYLKSATTVGDVLGRYHPHGDSSVYDAMVRLAQSFSLRYPLVDGHGNFGNIDGDPAAAYRYTEAKMAKMALEMVRDIDKETVDFIPNYDERLSEPVVLPSRFPNLLVNGSVGIAVGMATSIPPHNLGEVIDAVIYLMENEEATVDELLNFIQGPDFPTGGIVMGKTAMRNAYNTGRGKITVRAKTEIEEYKDGRFRILVTEIPYMVNKSKLLQDIAEHVNTKRIEGIHDLRDESDRNGMTIVIELKRDANPQVVLNQLFKNTQLQDTFSIILLALSKGEPKILNLKQILEEYIAFQKEVIIRRTKYDLKKALDRAHILEGLLKALDHIDEIISMIRASKTVQEAKENLIARFEFSDIQAQKIVEMRLGQLTGLEREKIESEYAEITALIAELRDILNNDDHVIRIIREELLVIKDKFGDKRKTEFSASEEDLEDEDLIEEQTCVYTLTHCGYIKRLPEDTYKVQNRGGRGITAMTTREEDYVEELFIGSTHNFILFFTNDGRVHAIKGYRIPESSRQSKGMNVVNLLQLEEGEKITAMIPVSCLDEEGLYLNMITKRGISKRCSLCAYKNLRKNGLIAINLDEGDELVSVRLTDGNQKIIVASNTGMAIEYDENQVSVLGRTARGVRAIRLKPDEYVVGAIIADDSKKVLTVTEKGYGKRSEFSVFKTQKRGGKGVRCHKLSEKTGNLASIRSVTEDEDLIVISSDGIIIRIRISDIPIYGRTSGGVRIMRLSEGVYIVNTAPVEAADNEEVTKIEIDPEEAAQATAEAADDEPTEEETTVEEDVEDEE
ncbi:MAG: DNA gyrase subunit A [Clostridiales bacterium]|nr:MAG: DNA gyrase subunit A [Clostridiales bacterium]